MSAQLTFESLDRTVRRSFGFVEGPALRRALELAGDPTVATVWTWLTSHKDGWITTVAAIANAISRTARTAYRALERLERVGLIRRQGDNLHVLLPSDIGVTRDQGEHARASIEEKPNPRNEPTSTTQQPTIAREPSRGSVSQKTATTDPNQMNDAPTPVTSQPPQAPDNAKREPVKTSQRVELRAFLETWTKEFRSGPSHLSFQVLPSNWQSRVLWLWQYWTADEIRHAFRLTRDRQPDRPWRYFCALLEKTASGDLDKPPEPQLAANMHSDEATYGIKTSYTFGPKLEGGA